MNYFWELDYLEIVDNIIVYFGNIILLVFDEVMNMCLFVGIGVFIMGSGEINLNFGFVIECFVDLM